MQISYEHTSRVAARRLCQALRQGIVAFGLIGVLLIAPFGAVPTGATTSLTSLELVQQSNWVGQGQGLSISLVVSAPFPSADLVLRADLYPRLLSRYAIEHSPFESGPAETLNNIALGPVNTVNSTVRLNSTVQFRVVTAGGISGGPLSARRLTIDCLSGTCNGNYPLTLTLMTRKTHRSIASLTTMLTYIGPVGTSRHLDVALALPFDLPSPVSATPELTDPQIAAIAATTRAIATNSSEAVTLAIYGRLLDALGRAASSSRPSANEASAAIRSFTRLSKKTRIADLLRVPYGPIDLNALIAGGGSVIGRRELLAQITAGENATSTALHTTLDSASYLSPVALGPAAAALISSTGTCDIALPSTNISLNQRTEGLNAPFSLTNVGAPCQSTSAIGASVDAGLSAAFAEANTSPVLAAHQLLADLAQTYFENPNATGARGVIISPESWSPNPVFISTLLAGLRANPILSSVTLSTYFRDLRIGSDNGPTSGVVENIPGTNPVSSGALANAYAGLETVRAITPSDQSLESRLGGAIFAGESVGLTEPARADLFHAPWQAVSTIGSSLHLSGTSHVTFTAASGKIPITIHYAGPVLPVHLDLRIYSSKIALPASETRQDLLLSLRDTTKVLVVSTRTSGLYTINLELLVPHQPTVLFGPVTFTITSTAASKVAIALSVGALLVLFLWWSRSILRHRRAKIAKGADQSGESGPITT